MNEFLEKLSNMTLKEIEERLSQLDVEVRSMKEVSAIEEATEQKAALLARKAELEALEARKQTATAKQSLDKWKHTSAFATVISDD